MAMAAHIDHGVQVVAEQGLVRDIDGVKGLARGLYATRDRTYSSPLSISASSRRIGLTTLWMVNRFL